ncbi:MAG TPA: HAD family hydrolase [Planctomycetes bacterium]|nr:HAD family hydrolase [Planctomycetota bacterium]
MAILDDGFLDGDCSGIRIVKRAGRREISHVFHDVDGTHSLIRDWPPVMSLSIHWAMTCGLKEDFDSKENAGKLIERVGREKLDETDRFCVESAGLSALTQMEYGIRRALELGNVSEEAGIRLDERGRRTNSEIIRRIWNGEERFEDVDESAELKAFIRERTPWLFRLYETILNGACRDRNTEEARRNPEKWRVAGAMDFMQHLKASGCVNYFVTGAVIYEEGGMFEEVEALGFETGRGKLVEQIRGSSWDKKMPKGEVMRELVAELGISPSRVLVVGDGRTEIQAGAEMGCVTMSRLPKDAGRQRELHAGLGTNYIVADYTDPRIRKLIRKG